MSPPLVSIVIPTYNRAAAVVAAVDSCLRQTYAPLEVIVIDDGSTDGTAAALQPCVAAGRIRYLRQANAERSAARNRGLDLATGAYIQFLDDDDALHPEKLQRQVAFLESHPECFGVGCGTEYLRAGQRLRIENRGLAGVDTRTLLRGNVIPIHAMLARRSELRFDPRRNCLEDWLYWLHASRGRSIAWLPEILCATHVQEQLTPAYRRRLVRGEIAMLRELLRDPDFACYRWTMRYALLRKRVKLGLLALAGRGPQPAAPANPPGPTP